MVKERSVYWTSFTKTEPNRARCKFCCKELSYHGGITNLVKHLRSRHPEINARSPHQDSEATTIIITTKTDNDGHIIATIEPFTETVKNAIEVDWENPIEISLDESQKLSSAVTKRVLKKRSSCWSVFTKVNDNKVSCGYCGKKFSFSHGRISNLKRHLKMKHDGLYHNLNSQEIEKKRVSRSLPTPEVSKARFDKLSKRTRSLFSVSSESDIPQDILTLMEETREKIGFVPNAFQVLSHRPGEMRAFLTYYNSLMEDRLGSHLTRADKEMILVAVSAVDKCKYSTVVHSALFRISSDSKVLADQIATNWETAPLDERQRCILQFAMKVTKCEPIKETDFGDLLCYGLDVEDAWDIGSLVSFCSLSNRMAILTNMLPNEQFYSLGRTEQLTKL